MRRNNVSAVREKYDENHPVVSFRTSEPTYKLLKDLLLKQEKSIGEFFREALGVEQRSYNEAYGRGYKEGFAAAKEKYGIAVICMSCFNGFYITSEKLKDTAEELLYSKYTFVHKDCEAPADEDPSRIWRSHLRRQD